MLVLGQYSLYIKEKRRRKDREQKTKGLRKISKILRNQGRKKSEEGNVELRKEYKKKIKKNKKEKKVKGNQEDKESKCRMKK